MSGRHGSTCCNKYLCHDLAAIESISILNLMPPPEHILLDLLQIKNINELC